MNNVVSLSDITLIRDKKRILDHVDWHVRSGEHWAIVGPNGSGKTSMLQVATGYEWPSAGSGPVEVLGERFGRVDLRELRKRIGWAGSALNKLLPNNQTPVEIAISGLHAATKLFKKPTEAEVEQARNLLNWFGIGDAIDRALRYLSLGERQKTILARALMPQPELLILDEPCAGLDLTAREQLLDRIARLADRCTLIHVTHHIEEIWPVFTHAALIDGGRIAARGLTDEVFTSENLTSVFRMPIEVKRTAGRFWPRLIDREK